MEELFKLTGGEFVTPIIRIAEKHKNIKAYIFDWDGVFNRGEKGENISSPFYEADAMGINMLRFAWWLRFRNVPITIIITGENNLSSFQFARREHLQSVYYSMKTKLNALEHLSQTYGISYNNIAYVFDDVLDLPVAELCGIRIMVKRNASPAFTDLVKKKKLCDYITGSEGGNFAVREAAEMLLSSTAEYTNVIEERIKSGFNYSEYISMRDELNTSFFTQESGVIIKKEPK